MLRKKLERSEKSRNELRQSTDLLESKVAASLLWGSPCGVRSVHREDDNEPGVALSALQAFSKQPCEVHALIVPILQRRRMRPGTLDIFPRPHDQQAES